MGQDSASSRVSVFYPVLLVLLVLSCVLLCTDQGAEEGAEQVSGEAPLVEEVGSKHAECFWFPVLRQMEGTFSAKPLLGHARPDPLRPCYLRRVHPDFPSVWPSTRI